MNVSRESSDNGEIVLRLEVDPERVGRHINAAVRRVAQRVDIPGFRKGKAPRAILQNFVGKDYLVEEAMESLVPEAVGEAVSEQEIVPFAPPRVDNVEQTEPTVTIVATVPTKPEVVLGDYQSLRYDEQPDEVDDEAVDALVMQLRRSQAYSLTAERAAEESDIVTLDIKVTADDDLVWDFEDRQFQLNLDLETYGEVFVGLHQGIIGMSVGDDKEFSFEVSEDNESPQFAGKTVHVTAHVKEVQEEVLPPLDDALASSVGLPEVETVEQLTTHIRNQLEERAEQTFLNGIQQRLMADMVESSEFTISPIIVDHESQHVLERYVQQRRSVAARTGQQFNVEDLSEDDLNEAKEIAEREIKNSLVVQSLVEAVDPDISDDDVTKEIEFANENAPAEAQRLEDNDETRQSVIGFLKRRRTIEQVLKMARGQSEDAAPAVAAG